MNNNQPQIERQELWCHGCDNYVQFDMDISINGNHILECPRCGHEHCRVVRNGKITDIRWGSRNGPTVRINSSTTSVTSASTYDSYTSGSTTASTFLYGVWMNRSTG